LGVSWPTPIIRSDISLTGRCIAGVVGLTVSVLVLAGSLVLRTPGLALHVA
jgi:hypothetical protein